MNQKKNQYQIPALFLTMALALLLTACGGGQNTAATMHLVKTEGTVQVDDAKGKPVKIMENLGLYSGYEVATQASSYGWINLDDTKLAKMDERSEVEVRKNDKLLELRVRSGSLFFNVTEPLADDESMNIRTSTMIVGIRGTCGWVEVEGKNLMCVYLLRGKVECTILDEDGNALTSETITAGQAAKMIRDGDTSSITVAKFNPQGTPDFVMEELIGDNSLTALTQPGLAETDAPAEDTESAEEEIESEETGLPETESADSQSFHYAGTYTLYEAFGNYSQNNTITLNTDGTVSGAMRINGTSPVSFTQNEDGIVSLLYRINDETESYTIYPPGADLPSWGAGYDNSYVYMEYLYTGGGAINFIYRADPASLEAAEINVQQPTENQTYQVGHAGQEGQAIETLPIDYVGEYMSTTDDYEYPVTLAENGVCSGWGNKSGTGPYNHYGSKPLSLTQYEDGCIVIEFNYATYTIYPAGLVPEGYEDSIYPDTVNLLYASEASYGVHTIWYHK